MAALSDIHQGASSACFRRCPCVRVCTLWFAPLPFSLCLSVRRGARWCLGLLGLMRRRGGQEGRAGRHAFGTQERRHFPPRGAPARTQTDRGRRRRHLCVPEGPVCLRACACVCVCVCACVCVSLYSSMCGWVHMFGETVWLTICVRAGRGWAQRRPRRFCRACGEATKYGRLVRYCVCVCVRVGRACQMAGGWVRVCA
jgi:hypothetical protein